MGRWDDDARSQYDESRRQDTGGDVERVATRDVVRELRDVEPRRPRDRGHAPEHHLTLPSGRDREHVRDGGRDYRLRGSEVDLLERTARFRSVFTEDLERDAGDGRRFRHDLHSLERQGLIEERTITRLRDGRVADVVSVTSEGKSLLDHHRNPHRDEGQTYYAGWVKASEVWHDSSLFRMTREVESEVERDGGRVRRVILDDELKARAYRALHQVQKNRNTDEDAHWGVAATQGLHVEDGRFVFPDVRLEIEDQDGSVRTVDLELVTEHYHRGHIGGKSGAGFRMFSSGSAGGRGTPRDSRLMKDILR